MPQLTLRARALALLCFAGVLSVTDAAAQSYPAKVVRYIVPGTPGAGADIVGRVVASGLTEVFGRQVIVDNRPGAASNIGAEIASKAPPDGYTLLHINITHAVNASLYRNLGYDLLRDFAPVSQVATAPAVVVVHPSLPVKSIAELVKLAKAKPGVINYASAGTGSSTFLAAELFKSQAGINMVHVPYKGGGEAQTSVVSGETSIYFASLGTVLPYIKQGRLRALAVTSPQRVAMMPDYPTVAELGYPNYQAGNWHGVLVPAKTPRELVTTLRNAIVAGLKLPAVSKRLSDLAYLPVGDQPDEFARFLQAEVAALGKVVKQLGLSAD